MKRWLGARIHISWLIAVGCLSLVVGVALSRITPVGVYMSPTWLLCGLTLMVPSLWHGRRWTILLMIVAGLTIGVWRGSLVQGDLADYRAYIGGKAALSGTILEDKDVNARSQTVLRIGDITVNETRLTGSIWVTVSGMPDVKRSDTVYLEGKLTKGFGTFAATMYDADIVRITRDPSKDPALAVRDTFAGGVETSLHPTEASLGLGYLTGQRRGLPPELDTALQAAGLTHIVVASGYNLTILVRFARRLFENVSKYLSFMTSMTMILGFIAVTGMSPSMSRAGLVAGLSLVAWYFGRKLHPLVLLPLAAAVTVLVQPSYVWGDIGWLLSFAAFGGVMILAPLLNAYFFDETEGHALRRIMVETISAQIVTLPVLMATFGTVSLIAPIANMLILPLVPFAMILTFVAGIGGLVVPSIALVFGLPAQALLQYMTTTAQFLGNVSWAQQEVTIGSGAMVLMYVGIIVMVLYLKRATGYSLRQSSIVE